VIDNLNIILLCGGHHVCDRSWNKAASELDQCYKIYFPVRGEAKLVIDGEEMPIRSGSVYLISGFHIENQYCKKEMEVYWLHFMPESLELRHVLSQVPPFLAWDADRNFLGRDGLHAIDAIFGAPRKLNELKNIPRTTVDASLLMKINSIILYLLSDVLGRAPAQDVLGDDLTVRRLKPSIDFMNNNLRNPPSLAEIAEQSQLAPNYFHRLFRKTFGVTPLHYMTRKRLDVAKHLLATSQMSVKEVAKQMGFENEFYFSRVFRKNLNITPSEFRKRVP
jgi:AraC-like DNA-binding protein